MTDTNDIDTDIDSRATDIAHDPTGFEDVIPVDLYHVHLPKLAEAGCIVWDEATATVRRGPNFGEIEPLLELIRAHGDELPAAWR